MLPELTGPSGLRHVVEGVTIDLIYMEVVAVPSCHSFTWRLNHTILDGRNSSISLENSNLTLVLMSVTQEDSGNYTLTAVNLAGQSSLHLELLVICMCA